MTAAMSVKSWGTISRAIALGVVGICLSATSAAAEITVLCSTALTDSLAVLMPEFERETGHKVAAVFKTTNVIVDQVRGGQEADLIIVGHDAAVDLEKLGKLVAGSRLDIASSSVGLAVRAGAVKPDITTVEAFKQTMLAAKVVAVSKTGLSGVHFLRVTEKLGIANEMRPKLKLVEGAGRTADFIATGEADMAVQLISELMGAKGVEVVGPFPPGIDNSIVLTSGIFVGAKVPEAARALVTFLKAPSTGPALKRTGVEPM
jgi:molybdate transport system substrate-binding protein